MTPSFFSTMAVILCMGQSSQPAAGMSASQPNESSLAIVPRPMKVERGEGEFVLTPVCEILLQGDSADVQAIGKCLSDELVAATGLKLAVRSASAAPPNLRGIFVTQENASADLGEEGYELLITRLSVTVRAPRPAGLLYAIQTIRQLLPVRVQEQKPSGEDKWAIPAVHIHDKPRFAWRGLLLDVSRHFRTKEFVKRYIDLLAYHKMNVLHWHITDDQGWRIEIKKYPKLTEVGAWRQEDGKRYGGFYTQDDIREVVAYAASRFVTVVPEIEMPGHCNAAIAGYPEYSCTGGPFQVPSLWGVFQDVYCAGNDSTFAFVQDVLTEVLDLFPSRFIHIGGDEVDKTRWKACPKCQKRIRDEHLKGEHELQSYFIRRIDSFLQSKGRRLIGWDEILEGGLAGGATVQSWRGMDGAIAACRMDHDVIASPTSHCYLDYPLVVTPLEKTYLFEPVPVELTAAQAKHVLGAEGNMWAEHTPEPADTDRQVYPRLCAIAELAWSPRESRDLKDFSKRLTTHLKRLRQMGVQYGWLGTRAGQWTPSQMSTDSKEVEWDVSKVIDKPGRYELSLWYERGAHALVADWAALLENNQEIARDTHSARAGSMHRDNMYRFAVKVRPSGATYRIRAHVRSDGGTDSTGSAWLKCLEE